MSKLKPILKWSGVAVGALVAVAAGFVGIRWFQASGEWEDSLESLVPDDTAIYIQVDSVPQRRVEIRALLDQMADNPKVPDLQASPLWQEHFQETFGEGFDEFRDQKFEKGIRDAEQQADGAGLDLFDDILSGEVVYAADPQPEKTEFLLLTRVSQEVRFKWSFLGMAEAFFPDDPNAPEMTVTDGILRITPQAKPDKPAETMMITVLDDVLVVSNSERLLANTIDKHTSERATPAFVSQAKAITKDKDATMVIGMDLNRLRNVLPTETKMIKGEPVEVSPVDAYSSLPNSIINIYPDVIAPISEIVRKDVDTRPFATAVFTVNLSESTSFRFTQTLIADKQRMGSEQYAYMRKTLKQPTEKMEWLNWLPDDTMTVVQYSQPLDLLFNEVFNEADRKSLIGDFLVAANGPALQSRIDEPVSRFAFAGLPRKYAPNAFVPSRGTDVPIPGFMLMFQTKGADEDTARVMLEEYLQAQRGRVDKAGGNPEVTLGNDGKLKGRFKVIQVNLGNTKTFGLYDQKKAKNPEAAKDFMGVIGETIRCCVVGDWLFLTNAPDALAKVIDAANKRTSGLGNTSGSVFHSVGKTGHATAYLNFDEFAKYASNENLLDIMRKTKFNPSLIDGLDPIAVRREITRDLGLDPDKQEDFESETVGRAYMQRLAEWKETCRTEGGKYVNELRLNYNAIRVFRDMAVMTEFDGDQLTVTGEIRFR